MLRLKVSKLQPARIPYEKGHLLIYMSNRCTLSEETGHPLYIIILVSFLLMSGSCRLTYYLFSFSQKLHFSQLLKQHRIFLNCYIYSEPIADCFAECTPIYVFPATIRVSISGGGWWSYWEFGGYCRVGILVSADIQYQPILTNIGKTDISVSVNFLKLSRV